MEVDGFYNCWNLESVYFPSAFFCFNSGKGLGCIITECKKLSEISVSESNPNHCVYDGALYSKDMQTLLIYPSGDTRGVLRIPDGVKIIADGACAYNLYVKEIMMPDTVTGIGSWAFDSDRSLERIRISENCEHIGQFVFMWTKLKEIFVPASVEDIMSDAICNNELLEEILVDKNNPKYHSHNGVLCTSDTVVAYPTAKKDAIYQVEDGMLYIEMSAFSGVEKIEEVVLPDTIKLLKKYAFFNCPNLREL